MGKIIKIAGIVIGVLIVGAGIFYLAFIHESPVDQEALNEFLKDQPIIDMHQHAVKGFENSTLGYAEGLTSGPTLDKARLDWQINAMNEHNIVLALAGGPVAHASNWMATDDRFWAGVTFPYNSLLEQDEPFIREFLTYEELRDIYDSLGFKSMGESMYMYYGVHPHDERLAPYWRIASEFDIPIMIHADGPPPAWFRDDTIDHLITAEYGNPELLYPILDEYPNLRLVLYHFVGDFSDESLTLMTNNKNVYCDISAVSAFMPKILWESKVRRLFDLGLGDRLVYGSDYPESIRKHIEVIYSMDWLTDEQKKDIFYNNAARFLKLSDQEIAEHYETVRKPITGNQ